MASDEERTQVGYRPKGYHLAVLLARFPALRDLGKSLRPRQIPHVEMMSMTECGAACLSAVLQYFGKAVSVQEVRTVLNTTHGTDAQSLLDAANMFGLMGQGVSLEVEQLEYLSPGAILHWEFNHYVVYEKHDAQGVTLMDPGVGRRVVPMEQFRRSFTGVALLLQPSNDFEEKKAGKSHFLTQLFGVLQEGQLWVRILTTSALLQLFHLATPIVTGTIVDTIVPLADRDLLSILGVAMFLMVVLHVVGTMVREHLLVHLKTHLDARLTPTFLDHLVQLPYSFFQQVVPGELTYLLSSTSSIRDLLTSTVLTGLIDGVLVISYFILLLIISPTIAALTLGLALAQLFVFLASQRRRTELLAQELHTETLSAAHASDVLHGIESLKALGVETRAVQFWTSHFVRAANVQIEKGQLNALVDAIIDALRFGSPLFILGVGAHHVLQGHMGLGAMLAVNALAMGVLEPLHALLQMGMQLEAIKQHALRLDRVLQLPKERSKRRLLPPRRLQGAVELDEVSFRYGPLVPFSIQKVSLTITPGQFVAIVGKSGSGKSTLATLIAGLHEPAEGRILFDGESLRDLDKVLVRRQLGYVPQRPFMMNNSIRANVALLDDTQSMEAIVKACQRACIHDEILEMPMAYETMLMGDGSTISGGQKQRLALARAVIRNPSILLLDEATSALDSLTERQVIAQLQALRCTRIVVAHRLSTVIDADLIVVMDKGRIVERGTHEELVRYGGAYHRLIATQSEAA